MQKNPAILMGTYTPREMNFLLNCPPKTDAPNPLKEWLPDTAWFAVQRLIEIEGFENFASNMEEAPAKIPGTGTMNLLLRPKRFRLSGRSSSRCPSRNCW